MHAAVARNDGPLAELSAAYGHQGNAGHNMKLCIRARKDRVLMPLFTDSQWLDMYSGMRRRERTAKLFKAARNAKKAHRRPSCQPGLVESSSAKSGRRKSDDILRSGSLLCIFLFLAHLVAFVDFLQAVVSSRHWLLPPFLLGATIEHTGNRPQR